VDVIDQSVILVSCQVGKHIEEFFKCDVLVMAVLVWFVICWASEILNCMNECEWELQCDFFILFVILKGRV
jgi:hypothetical protein